MLTTSLVNKIFRIAICWRGQEQRESMHGYPVEIVTPHMNAEEL